MLDIGAGEFLALGAVAVIVLGPERLPRYAAEAARVVRKVRRLADDARAEVSKELGPEFGDVSLRDLNPRAMVRKHLLDPLELDDDDEPKARGRGPGEVPRAESGRTSPATPPPYDPDAT